MLNEIQSRLLTRLLGCQEAQYVDVQTETIRAGQTPCFDSIDILPLTEHQKLCVIEYLAHMLTKLETRVTGNNPCRKHYDPMVIDANKKVIHSHTFDLEDTGHPQTYTTLSELETQMIEKTIQALTKTPSTPTKPLSDFEKAAESNAPLLADIFLKS